MKTILRKPIISLIPLAILCGFIWRYEVEIHNWYGLIWLTYFHYAIPVGCFIFLLWSNLFLKFGLRKRLLFNFLSAVFAIVMYYVLSLSLFYSFISGPSAMFIAFSDILFYRKLLDFLIVIIPVGAYLILRIFGKNPSLLFLAISIILFIVSFPFSAKLLEFLNHKGSHDYVHSIKSGVINSYLGFFIRIINFRRKEIGLFQI